MAAITIAQLTAKGSEHGEQVALFAWAALAHHRGWAVAWKWAETGVIEPMPKEVSHAVCVPDLEWLHAIPNGGSRGDDEKARSIRGGQMKAEGARSGVPDVFLPVPRLNKYRTAIAFCGLYIEMKKPMLKPKSAAAKGGLSDDQLRFRDYAYSKGYGWIVCYSWQEAAKAIEQYLTHGNH